MAMSDCEKCWSTPCTCGWDYRFHTKEKRVALAAVILGLSTETLVELLGDAIPENHPNARKK